MRKMKTKGQPKMPAKKSRKWVYGLVAVAIIVILLLLFMGSGENQSGMGFSMFDFFRVFGWS